MLSFETSGSFRNIQSQHRELYFLFINLLHYFKSLVHEDILLPPKDYHLLRGFMETARCLFNEAITQCGWRSGFGNWSAFVEGPESAFLSTHIPILLTILTWLMVWNKSAEKLSVLVLLLGNPHSCTRYILFLYEDIILWSLRYSQISLIPIYIFRSSYPINFFNPSLKVIFFKQPNLIPISFFFYISN